MNHEQKVRYARNISLNDVGEVGQVKLLESKVLVVGSGGLASPLLLYLAAAGIGDIGIVDDDIVALSNLGRQVIFETSDIGQSKVDSAVEALHDLNPDIKITPYNLHLNSSNIDDIVKNYDIVADCCDNFETRFLVNQACKNQNKTLVSAAVMGFAGQLYTFKPYLGTPHPCYQCIHPEIPPAEATPRCSEAGVLGSVVGQMGTWQATEIIKELLHIGKSLSGYMVVFDGLSANVRKIKLHRDLACKCCGNNK